MKKLIWIAGLFILPIWSFAQEEDRIDPNAVTSQMTQLIPSPVEMIVWGKSLE